MKIHSIAACCNNRGIGKQGSLPWKMKKEMKYFSKMTKGNPPEGKKNAVIFGRKTWNSFPGSMKGRYNFVVSQSLKEKTADMDALVHSKEELEDLLTSPEWSSKIHQVFNGGGSAIYEMTLNSSFCGRVYLTRIKKDYDCDTFFPDLKETEFKLLQEFPSDVASELPAGIQVEEDGTEWFVEVYEKI